MARRAPLILATTAALMGVVGALLLTAPAHTAAQAGALSQHFDRPPAPSTVEARTTRAGVLVTWGPAPEAQPAPTHAIVDSGPGSCPVTVPADRTSVILPIVTGQSVIVPRVRWVNALGMSPPRRAGAPLRVGHLATSTFQPVQILSLADFHGHIESNGPAMGAARLTAAFARDRSTVAATVSVSTGDNFGKSPLISDLFEEYPTIESLNAMGLDVSTFGNHEHDRPLSHVRDMVEASDFAWTVANYSDLSPVSGVTKPVQPHVLIERAGLTIGVVGMNVPRTVRLVPRENLSYEYARTLDIEAGTEGVIREALRARAAGADVVILLAHQGWTRNEDGRAIGPLLTIAGEVHEHVDVVLGGHTHREFSTVVGDTLVVQTRGIGRMYGRSQLCIDTTRKRVIGVQHSNVRAAGLAGLEVDSAVEALVDQYAQRRDAELGRVVGRVVSPLDSGAEPARGRAADFPLGNYVADLMRREYRTELALINAGTFRGSLPQASAQPPTSGITAPVANGYGTAEVTLGDLMRALTKGKPVVTTRITGAKLWTAMERALADYPNNRFFLQVSGLRMEFDSRLPEGERVTGLWDSRGSPILRNDRAYSVATLDYLVNRTFGRGPLFDRAGTARHTAYLQAVIEDFTIATRLGRVVMLPSADGRLRNLAE